MFIGIDVDVVVETRIDCVGRYLSKDLLQRNIARAGFTTICASAAAPFRAVCRFIARVSIDVRL